MIVVEILTSLDYEEFPYLIVAEFSSLLKNNVSLKPQDLISADEIFSKDSYRKFYFGTVTEKDMLDENIWRYEVHINKELKAWNYPYKTSKNQDYNCHSFFVYILTPVDKTRRIFQCINRIQSPPFQIRCSRRNPSNNQNIIHQNNKTFYNIYKQSQLMKLIHKTEEKLPPDNNRISINRENINISNTTKEEDDEYDDDEYNLPNLTTNNNNNSSPSSSSSSVLLSPDVMNIFDELDDISNIESAKCPMSKYYKNYNSILSVDNDEENYESLIKKCPYHSKQQQQLSSHSSDVVLIPNTFLKSSPPSSSTSQQTTNQTQSINTKTLKAKEINKVIDDDENRYESCCKENYLFLLPIIILFFIIMIILVYIDSKNSNSYTSVLGEKLMIYQLLLKQLNYHYSCYSDIIKFNTTFAMDFMSKSFENQINDLLKFERESLSNSCQFLLYHTLSDDNCSFSQQTSAHNSNLQFYFILGVLTIGLLLHVIHRYVILPKVKSNI